MKSSSDILSQARIKAASWLIPSVDAETQSEIRSWMDGNEEALKEAFYSDLEFGTGGLRGVMGTGTACVNRYTIGMATQGLANYIRKTSSSGSGVAIAYDSRNNSRTFAEVAAGVLSANGIQVYLFNELRPTPLLSFAVRHLGCQAGIVITASHNPKEYNGYKVYWSDGAQVLPPHDKGIIEEVRQISSPDMVSFGPDNNLIRVLNDEIDTVYLDRIHEIVRSSGDITQATDMKIVYTSIHGAGITLVPKALEKAGFSSVVVVGEQAIPDGNFPTVQSPNPEEKEALDMALSVADQTGADLVIGTDPDTDRVGLAIRDDQGRMMLLNGNQSGSLLVYYQLMQLKAKGLLRPDHFVAKTIVTTELIARIAQDFGVKVYNTLTGFKYIAGVMGEKDGKEEFICGGEESYGYLVGDFVRDKDGVISSVALAEVAAWGRNQGKGMFGMLMDIYLKYGYFHEELLSLTYKGLQGKQQIADMMSGLRSNTPATIGGSAVVELRDYNSGVIRNLATGAQSSTGLPGSNVLQFHLADGSVVTGRPSGTEPKIKFYFSLRSEMNDVSSYRALRDGMASRILDIRKDLGVQ